MTNEQTRSKDAKRSHRTAAKAKRALIAAQGWNRAGELDLAREYYEYAASLLFDAAAQTLGYDSNEARNKGSN